MARDLTAVRRVLETLRRKVRSAWATRGLSIVGSVACAAALVSFGLDYALDLPLAVRAVHLALILAGLALLARHVLLRPLAVALSEEDLVQAVEHGVPEMRDRLVSALDFERRLDDPAERESREMMAGVVDEAVQLARGLDPSSLVDFAPARRARNVAVGAASLVVLAAILFPAAFGLWLRRGLLLSDIEWPRRTRITVPAFPTDRPHVITRGDDLPIEALAEGIRPRELVLHYEELAPETGEDDERLVVARDERTMYPVEGEKGRYATVFPSVSSSFRFWVTGGDDDDVKPLYTIKALVPPRIASITANITYPEYTGLPPETRYEAHADVLAGSRIEFELGINMAIAEARLLPADGEAQELDASGGGRTLTFGFTVEEDREFHIELLGPDGQRNRPEDDVFHIRTVEDRPPTLRVLYPLERLYRTPEGIIPLKTRVEDDFGVAVVSVDLLHGTDPLEPLVLWPEGPGASPLGKRVDSYRPIDLRDYQGDGRPLVRPGEVLELTVVAQDNLGKERTSNAISVEVLSPEDLQRRLHQRQIVLREELGQVRRDHRRTLSGLRGLRRALGDGVPDGAALDRGRDLQVDQGRVGNGLRQFLSGVHQVFDTYVLNRHGSQPTVERLLPIYHDVLAQDTEDIAGVFGPELYRRVLVEKRAGRLFDPEVLGALLDIVDIGDSALSRINPAIFDALDAWGQGPEHDAASLAKAEEHAEELERQLAELERRMERWEDFNEFIQQLMELKETQETLARPLREDSEDEGSDK